MTDPRPAELVDTTLYVFTDRSGEDGDGIPFLDWEDTLAFITPAEGVLD